MAAVYWSVHNSLPVMKYTESLEPKSMHSQKYTLITNADASYTRLIAQRRPDIRVYPGSRAVYFLFSLNPILATDTCRVL